MSEKHNGLRLVAAEDWVERFIRCQLSDLNGEVLRPDDAQFMDLIETTAAMMPGVLEEILIEHGLTSATPQRPSIVSSADDADTAENVIERARYRVAAASRESIYQQVSEAIEKEKDFVDLDVAGDTLALLRIMSPDGPLKPCFQENYTFLVEREATEPQTITPFGGVYLSLEELKTMFLDYNSENRTIRLYHS
jgi:hypothetical protein